MKDKISLEVDGLRIVGEVYYPAEQVVPRPAICLCHGIPASPPDPGKRGYRLLAERFAGEGFVTCTFNFRGTGESEGNLDLLGWVHDLGAMVGYLNGVEAVDKSRICLMGFSGGAATATFVTAHDKRVSALALFACPAEFSILTSNRGKVEGFLEQCRIVGTIRDDDFPPSLDDWLGHFHEVSPINWIGAVSPRPVLILHGDRDELIDLSHARRLYSKAKYPKRLEVLPGGEHRLRVNEKAIAAALEWLRSIF